MTDPMYPQHYPGHYSVPTPPPAANPADERTWSTLTHVGMLVVGIWVPLICYLVLRERGPFIRSHAATALNFELTWLIGYIGCFIVAFGSLLTFALPVAILAYVAIFGLLITRLILGIIAAMAAYKGQWYRYPMTIQFVK
ncbi:MAG TPA: DUF4870 domain-containing protein [Candidatus Lumbricidophila sp.]|nr:DUF4870 domain-containing protein [Candidatus Lumbricidophila sp.]